MYLEAHPSQCLLLRIERVQPTGSRNDTIHSKSPFVSAIKSHPSLHIIVPFGNIQGSTIAGLQYAIVEGTVDCWSDILHDEQCKTEVIADE